MKIHGHTHVAVLPTNPTAGDSVFLSADGVNGDLLYWSGVAWQSLAFTVYSNYRPDVEFELTLPASTPAIEHTWQQSDPSPTNTSVTLTSGTKVKVLGKLGVPNPYPQAFFHFIVGSEELAYNNTQISSIFGTLAKGYSNTNQFGLPQANALAVRFGDVNAIKPIAGGFNWNPSWSAATATPPPAPNTACQVTTLNIPSTTSIPEGAWAHCYSLSVVDLPATIMIGGYAFYGTSQLTTISLPSVVEIGAYAFSGGFGSAAVAIGPVTLPNCTTIGVEAFSYCGLSVINAPLLTAIPPLSFFQGLVLTTVLTPSAVSVGDNAFANCYAIVELDLSSVTTWGASVFAGVVGQTITLTIADSTQASHPSVAELIANNTVTLQYT
jgi:hypothetical protein